MIESFGKTGYGIRLRRQLFAAVFTLLVFNTPQVLTAQTVRTTYFPGTEYELNIYRIDGRIPGPVMLILGGIHNEPGGYLAADKLVDVTLEKGSLIVIPRANFQTIIHNTRSILGDMNRLFHLNDLRFENDHSMKIVKIIKELMPGCDVFLNLHDGRGFYRPTYVNSQYNPLRLGQTVIADAQRYTRPDGVTLELGEIANRVCASVNEKITNRRHFFRFLNHDTFNENTIHKEMRRSATFHTLASYHIPSYGIEISMNIPDFSLRVQYHNLILSAFMDEFGIVKDFNSNTVDNPKLDFITVSVNGGNPNVYSDGGKIHIEPGDKIKISHIESNYDRGLSIDILDHGGNNDIDREIEIRNSTEILIKKDSFRAGSLEILVSNGNGNGSNGGSSYEIRMPDFRHFNIEVNGFETQVPEEGVLEVIKGDVIRINDSEPSAEMFNNAMLNLWGYVSKKGRNSGDDSGELIDTSRDLLPDWSYNRKGKEYQLRLQRSDDDVEKRMLIRLIEPKLEHVVIRLPNGNMGLIEDTGVYKLTGESSIEITGVKTNIPDNEEVRVNLVGFSGGEGGNDLGARVNLKTGLIKRYSIEGKGERYRIEVIYRDRVIGTAFLQIPPGI